MRNFKAARYWTKVLLRAFVIPIIAGTIIIYIAYIAGSAVVKAAILFFDV